MKKRITLVTFLVFMAEAIIHYNQGYFRAVNKPFDIKKIKMPPNDQLMDIAVVVFVFSIINASLIEN